MPLEGQSTVRSVGGKDMIRVNEEYVILVDTLNYTPCRDTHRVDKKGNPVYKTVGYFPNLEAALRGIIRDMNAVALGEGTHSLQEALEVIQRSDRMLIDMLREVLGNGSN